MLQSVPKVAIAPLLLIWVGYGLKSNVIVEALVAFFPSSSIRRLGWKRRSRAARSHALLRFREDEAVLEGQTPLGTASCFQQPQGGDHFLGIFCFYMVVWIERLLCPWYLQAIDSAAIVETL
jgi:hypothetical protein